MDPRCTAIREEILELSTTQRSHRTSTTGQARDGAWLSARRRWRGRLRALYLAYAFLRGRPYGVMERRTTEPPPLLWVSTLAEAPTDRIEAWLAGEVGACVASTPSSVAT